MLSNTTKASQGGIRSRPCTKAWSDRGDDVPQLGKVLVVEAAPANQFPDPFDGIEFGTIGREEVENKVVRDFVAPFFVQTGVVIASVVDDHDYLSSGGLGDAFDLSIEVPASAGIQHPLRRRHDQFPVLQAHRTKVTDAFARWRMKADRVSDLRRNPHAAPRAMLFGNALHP